MHGAWWVITQDTSRQVHPALHLFNLPETLGIQVVVNKTEQAPDRANIDMRSMIKFGGCASQVD